MRAMIIEAVGPVEPGRDPLRSVDMPVPQPREGELLIEVSTCAVCHTELDEIEGRTAPSSLPRVPGHQVVGRVVEAGAGASRSRVGERVGVGWIHSACGRCPACGAGDDNLCPDFVATGRDADGGYAQLMTVPERFAFRVPDIFSDVEAAPLLCAGAIGYRSLRLAGLRDGEPLGLTGFGASGHLVLKMARHQLPRSPIFVFTRSAEEREFALALGAAWAGDTTDVPPGRLAAIIDTTPAWKPVVDSLGKLLPGGRLVINAIRKQEADKRELLRLDYPSHLWMEKEIKSVANVASRDVDEFLALAAAIPIRPEVEVFRLEEANRALHEIRARRIRGAKVLLVR
ncbi:MAG: alcohol dehydrogenase catalytic domain-containing protein [Vicinamibacterales bacterium]